MHACIRWKLWPKERIEIWRVITWVRSRRDLGKGYENLALKSNSDLYLQSVKGQENIGLRVWFQYWITEILRHVRVQLQSFDPNVRESRPTSQQRSVSAVLFHIDPIKWEWIPEPLNSQLLVTIRFRPILVFSPKFSRAFHWCWPDTKLNSAIFGRQISKRSPV